MPPATKKTETSQPQANLSHKTVGTFKNPTNGVWSVVEISFDPKTKTVGEIVEFPTDSPDRGIAQESFKIAAGYAVEAFL